MLKSIKDDNIRLSILGSYVEGMKGTFFRQTQFAEFEMRIHEKAEKGESLTGDELNKLYLDLTRKYYGHDKGICIVGDEIKAEWMFIPHFYYNFYVYQYATSSCRTGACRRQRSDAQIHAIHFCRWIGLRDRSLEKSRCRHDNITALHCHHEKNEQGDG
jgi:oligoendopeptidase F